MLTIARLFGKSPFAPLQSHMNKVAACIEKLTKIFESLPNKEVDHIERMVDDLSQLEHEADLTKNDIRNHLPKSIFMPIDRAHFLEILSIQDSIADMAEDVGITLALRSLENFDAFGSDLSKFYQKSVEVYWDAKRIIAEIDELLESAFGGIEAEKVKNMVEETAFKEHLSQKLKRQILKKLFKEGTHLSSSGFYHWLHLIEDIGALAQRSEKLANRIRMVLELK
jgi:uncharacterized protein